MKITTEKPFLSAQDITIRVNDTYFFEHTSWQMNENEHWLILGPNGSGKSIFAKALAGLLPLRDGIILCKGKISYLSFDTQQQIYAKENRKLDLASGIGKELKEKTVKNFLGSGYEHLRDKKLFALEPLLQSSILTLSTGELRKIFLVKTLLGKPQLLILDEPFDGLDNKSKKVLSRIISSFTKKLQLILIVHQTDEIPKEITHVLMMKNNHIFSQGKKEIILPTYIAKAKKSTLLKSDTQIKTKTTTKNHVLFALRNVTVHYHNKSVLNGIIWSVREGENWIILGPNGSGKSTLMHLITGDNQQAYANSITLFRKEKGKEISLWEIKQKIGIVSTDIMLRYDKQLSVYDVILSGFFDSIGLYKKATDKQKKIADTWITKLQITNLAHKQYHTLSFGQKRLVLITRAVVKSPKLLIVDEPCHGLDTQNRRMVLNLLNKIGFSKKTNLLLITHRKEEILSSITHKLILKSGKIIKKGKLSTQSGDFLH